MVSIIAPDLHVKGTLSSSGAIRVEGTVVGTVRAEHQVLVAKGGTIEGDIHAQEAILGGEVKGSILADGRVEVQAAAVIHGTIKTPRLVVNEGAKVFGPVHMAKSNGAGDPGSADD
jgi:cytoskeletal protein CcmA (bactofilin family)